MWRCYITKDKFVCSVVTIVYYSLSHLLGLTLSLEQSEDITNSDRSLDVSDEGALSLAIVISEENTDLRKVYNHLRA